MQSLKKAWQTSVKDAPIPHRALWMSWSGTTAYELGSRIHRSGKTRPSGYSGLYHLWASRATGAVKLVRQITKEILSLNQMPMWYRLYDEEPWKGQGLRCFRSKTISFSITQPKPKIRFMPSVWFMVGGILAASWVKQRQSELNHCVRFFRNTLTK